MKVVILALLQGVTELFPVSSLGHTVILPGFLGWGDVLQSSTFLPLVVTLHLGTAVALFTFFWRDWVELVSAGIKVVIAGRFTPDVDPKGHGRTMALVIVGTVPAGVIGVLLQKPLEHLFAQPILVSAFLVANGAVLLTAEYFWKREKRITAGLQQRGRVPQGEIGKTINDMSFGQALIIGCAQSLALLPGISRSGSTIGAGMAFGMSHEASARFSFLLATPIILAAGLVEVPVLFQDSHTLLVAAFGGLLAGIAAYLSVKFLMRYFETNRLEPFAYYCMGLGLLAFAFFAGQQLGYIPSYTH